MLEYLSIVLSFVAAAIAVFGDTWDSKRSGFRKLLPLGIAALVIGILAFSINFYNVHSSQSKIEESKKSDIPSLKSSLTQLVEPFKKLVSYTQFTIDGRRIRDFDPIDTILFYASKDEFKKAVLPSKLSKKYSDKESLN